MIYDSTEDTKKHIEQVRDHIADVIMNLFARANAHDRSKLEPPEKAIFDEFTPRLKESEYGSEDYKKNLEGMKVALDHHYEVNDHHPEHHANGVYGMSLIELMEMLADWKAATLRHETGDLTTSIELNAVRFGYDRHMVDILMKTAKDLGWL